MKIMLFYRKPGTNYSIERVFDTLLEFLFDRIHISKITVPHDKTHPICLWENIWYCYRNKSKVNHIIGDIHYCSLLLPYRRTILTIHDTILLNTYSGINRRVIYWLWYYLPLRSVKYVTCISEKSRAELLNYFPWIVKKVRVIYNPFSPEYTFTHRVFSSKCPVILHIGTRENKNLSRVIKALCDIPCELHIVGELTKKQISELEVNNINYYVEDHLTDSAIVEKYQQCDIVSFPSTYEGFGMPIIEGQATGRVVLTSNIAPMNEVAGGAAWLVDPFEISSIREGFLRLINDEVLRDRLIAQGNENIKRFSVEKVAMDYLKLYKEVAGE